jgi:hypothetical protein
MTRTKFFTIEFSAPSIEYVNNILIPSIEDHHPEVRVQTNARQLFTNLKYCEHCNQLIRQDECCRMVSDKPEVYYCYRYRCNEAFMKALSSQTTK